MTSAGIRLAIATAFLVLAGSETPQAQPVEKVYGIDVLSNAVRLRRGLRERG